MNLEALIVAIELICRFNDPLTSRAEKEACMEYFVNCSIGSDGKTDQELLKACIDRVGLPKAPEPTPGVKYRQKRAKAL